MKNALIYQSSDFDCGPTTLTNAMRFLCEREEIPPALLRGIWHYCNDTYNEQGEAGKHGTSKACIRFLAEWLNGFALGCRFPLRAAFADREGADIAAGCPAIRCLEEGGAVLMRCWLEGYGHYILLTGITEGGIAVFDPYDEPDRALDADILLVDNQPHRMNRIVSMARLNAPGREDYNAGDNDRREVLMLWRDGAPQA